MILLVLFLATMSSGFIQAEVSHRMIRTPQQTRQNNKPNEAAVSRQQRTVGSQQSYKPFSAVPDHIKQLISQSYQPQVPYVNPNHFFYQVAPPNIPQDQSQPKTEVRTAHQDHQQPEQLHRQAYTPKTLTVAKINPKTHKAPEDRRASQGSRSPLYTRLYQEHVKRSSEDEIQGQQQQDQGYGSMPAEIQMILQLQSQIPYNVLANEILFQPKKPFVPQPLPEDLKPSQNYPSKVYYIKSDGEVLDHVPAFGVGPVSMNYKSN